MGGPGPALLALLAAAALGSGPAPPALSFWRTPPTSPSSLGKTVRLRCRVRGGRRAPRDGLAAGTGTRWSWPTATRAQVPLSEDVWLGTSQLSIPAVQPSDAGRYQCWARAGGEQLLSTEAHLELAGLPFFSEEPRGPGVGVDTPFNLSCGARGPPEPVRLLWLQDGAPPQFPAGPPGPRPLHAGGPGPEPQQLLLLRSPQRPRRHHLPHRQRHRGAPEPPEPGAAAAGGRAGWRWPGSRGPAGRPPCGSAPCRRWGRTRT
ncbi:tyrosine-protein kinase receptor UFO [Mycteria americana]|uniref:tyrosine-protein kinase receptor UFO n=1 Tax=Mycteria americana TaxID=33587 RepID=UPI003F580347